MRKHRQLGMRVQAGGELTSLEELVRKTKKASGAVAVAVVSRDGVVLEADMPPSVGRETFSIMCATILGAGMTAAHELGKTPPHRVILESEDLRIVIRESGRRSMVVAVVHPDTDIERLDAVLKELCAFVAVQV